MSTEKPILFKADMVRAILDGRKTQTRRVVSPKALEKSTLEYADCTMGLECPYGQPGDHLWVKETWRIVGWSPENGDWKIEYSDGSTKWFDSIDIPEETETRYWIQCTEDCDKAGLKVDGNGDYIFEGDVIPTRKRPSIFMPRWASRITLEVVDVQVERVQEISHAEAVAEGCYEVKGKTWGRLGFSQLWDSINKKRGYGWDVNPWVWAVTFKLSEALPCNHPAASRLHDGSCHECQTEAQRAELLGD